MLAGHNKAILLEIHAAEKCQCIYDSVQLH